MAGGDGIGTEEVGKDLLFCVGRGVSICAMALAWGFFVHTKAGRSCLRGLVELLTTLAMLSSLALVLVGVPAGAHRFASDFPP